MKRTYTLFLASTLSLVVKSQDITTAAGTGAMGFSGDGGPALQANFNWIWGVTVKGADIYISDWNNNRIRKVNSSGIINTIAGNGSTGSAGDGGQATLAELAEPCQVALDKNGNIYFADHNNRKVRKITTAGVISTFAGTGVSGNSGDGGQATSAQFVDPLGLTIDSKGNVYVADYGDNKIRKIDTLGIITTFCGTGSYGYSGDGGSALSAQLKNPARMAVDKNDNIYFVDVINYCIRKVSQSGTITTVAGTGTNSSMGDGGQASATSLNSPAGVEVDSIGNIYIAEFYGYKIRKVNTSGVISTLAGNGMAGYSGDNGPAISATLNGPAGLSMDKSGKLYIAETYNRIVRVICPSNCFTGIEEINFQDREVLIYPNPSVGFFKVKTNLNSSEIIIYNSLGQKVFDKKLIQGENEIELLNLSSGFYNYSILENTTIVTTGKLTIQR